MFSCPISGYTLTRAGATLTITDATPGRDATCSAAHGLETSTDWGWGVAIANAVTTEPNPAFPSIPIKHFDFDAATELVGVNPALIDLIA